MDVFLDPVLSIHVSVSLIYNILNTETDKSMLTEVASRMLIA